MTYDEFLFSENDASARKDFEQKIAKRFGGDWRNELSKHDVTIRNLSRIVHAMVAAERQRGSEASSEASRADPSV